MASPIVIYKIVCHASETEIPTCKRPTVKGGETIAVCFNILDLLEYLEAMALVHFHKLREGQVCCLKRVIISISIIG